jgi:hypothetical protein
MPLLRKSINLGQFCKTRLHEEQLIFVDGGLFFLDVSPPQFSVSQALMVLAYSASDRVLSSFGFTSLLPALFHRLRSDDYEFFFRLMTGFITDRGMAISCLSFDIVIVMSLQFLISFLVRLIHPVIDFSGNFMPHMSL